MGNAQNQEMGRQPGCDKERLGIERGKDWVWKQEIIVYGAWLIG